MSSEEYLEEIYPKISRVFNVGDACTLPAKATQLVLHSIITLTRGLPADIFTRDVLPFLIWCISITGTSDEPITISGLKAIGSPLLSRIDFLTLKNEFIPRIVILLSNGESTRNVIATSLETLTLITQNLDNVLEASNESLLF